MANRRMFSKTIVEYGRFLRMPLTSQALYFHLGVNADDDGVVEAYPVMSQIKASDDDLRILASKGFVRMLNQDLLVVINDWTINNRIRKDRYQPSIYRNLLNDIEIVPSIAEPIDQNADTRQPSGNQVATKRKPDDNQMATRWQPHVNQTATQVSSVKDSLGKGSLGKDSLGKNIELVSLDKEDHSENQPTNNYSSDRDPNIHVQPDGSVSYGDNPVDCQSIINDFNKICKSHSKVTQLTANRERMIARMVIENHFTPETFHKLFTMFEQSDWLSGRGETSRFSMTFDWLLKDDNAIKVLEGNYENFAAGTNKPGYTGNAYIDAINHRFDGIDEWAAKGDANDQK